MVGIGPISFGLVNISVAKWVTLLSVSICLSILTKNQLKLVELVAVVCSLLRSQKRWYEFENAVAKTAAATRAHCLTDARISIDNWQAFNICPSEQSRLCNFWDWWIVRLLYQSYHTTTGLLSTLLLCYVGSCRLGKTIFEFDTRILLSNITVTYEACDVCMNFVPSYLRIYFHFLTFQLKI